MNHSQITSFIWSVADLIRDTFRRGKYQDVILPLTVLRRIDRVLQPTKGKVLATYEEYKGKLENLDDLLRTASGYAFYNASPYSLSGWWTTRRTSPRTCGSTSTRSARTCAR